MVQRSFVVLAGWADQPGFVLLKTHTRFEGHGSCGGSAGLCAPADRVPLEDRDICPTLPELPRPDSPGGRLKDCPVVCLLYTGRHVTCHVRRPPAEPSHFGSRCWCDIPPALNTSKQEGKQTNTQK